jgi:nanoRNase/pAp phosphatase (c-di-AMP/oligoRNAs hydrolase)
MDAPTCRDTRERPAADCTALLEALRDAKRLYVFTHDNPDPDAIAAAWLLCGIAEQLGVRARIVHGGRLGRAENRMMVRRLRIPLRALPEGGLRLRRGDRLALVDAQPGTGNTSLPAGGRCRIVIDHHPRRRFDAEFVDVRTDFGCTTTMLLAYFEACGLVPDASRATAAAYAIVSETQDLQREATRADRLALERLMPLLRLTDLGRIRHPPRRRAYYETIARAMREVRLGRHVCVCHAGPVPSAEVVAELADLLVAMERITWCLVSGWCRQQAVLSIRTTWPKANADRVMRTVLGRTGHGGGHGMMAGGSQPAPDLAAYQTLATAFTHRFVARVAPRTRTPLAPLLPAT